MDYNSLFSYSYWEDFGNTPLYRHPYMDDIIRRLPYELFKKYSVEEPRFTKYVEDKNLSQAENFLKDVTICLKDVTKLLQDANFLEKQEPCKTIIKYEPSKYF